MINLLYLFLVMSGFKLFINLSKYIQCKRYRDKYLLWLANPREGLSFVEHRSQVIKLFQGAGISDGYRPSAEFAGYGQIMTGSVSVFQNFPHRRRDMAQVTVRMFDEAVGVYRSRMLEVFNPLYWIEFIINLPKHVLSYLGVSPESIVVKNFQLIYWIVSAVFGLLVVSPINS